MKIVIAGGSGYLGRCVANYYKSCATDIVILSRVLRAPNGKIRTVLWDGKTPGLWCSELEGVELLVNLAGRSVDCRYNEKNRREIFESRINSVNVLGEAILKLDSPPRCWVQSSSATIYRHAEDRPQDEISGELGEGFSVDVCRAWEHSFQSFNLPSTRKITLRTGIVLGSSGGALPVMARIARLGFGGAMGAGSQYLSWIHENDFVAIVEWLRANVNAVGVYNCTAPWPLPNKLFMQKLAVLVGPGFRCPTPAYLLKIGAFIIGTETELILKSRWVKPTRLLNEGYRFQYPRAGDALDHLHSQLS
jgi:uncharacterized protein